ncbi:replication protein RepA [Candidatus Methylacidiphilum infernorum]|uniref:replication protein RepA n=1 Tax=Candidatus Methylacidiphilum infernorum TaxID=511746 RepID=UPI0009A206F4
MVLSSRFYASLIDHAVSFDMRAIYAVRGTALGFDIYTMLAYRLCRLTEMIVVSWAALKEQFGQEHANPRDFRREFIRLLRRVLAAYPKARVCPVAGGLELRPSSPPIPMLLLK